MGRTSLSSRALQAMAEKPAAPPLHRAAEGTPGPHRPFLERENGGERYGMVPLGDEMLPENPEIHPSSCALLRLVGPPPE